MRILGLQRDLGITLNRIDSPPWESEYTPEEIMSGINSYNNRHNQSLYDIIGNKLADLDFLEIVDTGLNLLRLREVHSLGSYSIRFKEEKEVETIPRWFRKPKTITRYKPLGSLDDVQASLSELELKPSEKTENFLEYSNPIGIAVLEIMYNNSKSHWVVWDRVVIKSKS